MRNKKGSHVGMVLSFVIFVTFIIFLYSALEPIARVERGKQDLLEFLKFELIEEFKEDLTSVVINISYTGSQKCIRVRARDIDTQLAHISTVVRDLNDNPLDSFVGGGGNVNIIWDKKTPIRIHYSDWFDNSGVDCEGSTKVLNNETDYIIEVFNTEEYVFLAKAVNLTDYINESETNYELLKNQLNVPPGDEFGFRFQNASGDDLFGTEEKNVSTSIYVDELPIQYVDSEANIKSGYISIRVW